MATRMSDEEAKRRREAAQQRKAAMQAANSSKKTQKPSFVSPSTLTKASTKGSTPTKTTSKQSSPNTTSAKKSASPGTSGAKKPASYPSKYGVLTNPSRKKDNFETGILEEMASKHAFEKLYGAPRVTVDKDAVQKSKQDDSERRIKSKQEQGKQKLSRYDQTKLNKTGKQLVREAKVAWDVANALGDEEGKSRAHQKAESARSYSGYSGGGDGSQYIRPDMGWAEGVELNKLTYEGQRQMNKARMDFHNAQQAGDKAGMEKARERAEEIRSSKGLGLAGETGNTDAYGRPIQDFDAEQEAKRLKSGAESVGKGIAGSLLSVSETGRQFLRNYNRDRWGSVIDANANQADALRAKLALAEQGEGNPAWGTVQELRNRLAAAEGAEQRRKTERTTVDPNLPGQTLLRESREAAAEATRGLSGADKLLANTVLSMGQTAPGIILSFVPGIGPALGLGLMGAQAAGSKAGELNEQGVDAREAMTRGLISGGIEALTEKLPMDQILKLVKGAGGTAFLKNVAKQAGLEASEETVSYLGNLIADKAAQDPNAKFSMQELLETAAIGGLSGAAFGGIGSAIGSVVNRGTTASQASSQESAAALTGQDALLRGAGLRTEETSPVQKTAAPAAEQAPAPRVAAAQEPAQAEVEQEPVTPPESAQASLEERSESFRRRSQAFTEKVQQAMQDPAQNTEEVLAALQKEADQLSAEYAALTQESRQQAGEVSRGFGTAENHIDNRTAGDMGDRSVKAFQFDYPQLHQYYVEAAQALKQDAEYSLDTQMAIRGQGTVVRRSEQLAQAEGLGLTRNQIIQVCDDIIADNGQENYAAAKRVELILDDMLSRGYIPNEGTTEADTKVPANEAYLQAKGQIEGAATGFDRYKRDNALALELGEVTEDQLRAEYDASLPEGQGAMSPGAAGDFPHWQNQRTDFHPINQDSVGAARGGFDPYSQMLNQYGAIEPGENPERMIDVPQSTNGRDRVRKFARTYAESPGLTDEMIARFEQDVANGLYSYGRKSLASVSDYARKTIKRKGFDGAMEQWEEVVQGYRRVTDDDIGLAQVLLSSATAAGDVETASALSAQIAAEGTFLGRAVNALRLLKRTTPEGRLYYLNRCIDKINQDFYDNGKDFTVNLNGELAQALLGAETEAEIDATLGPIYDDIARQIPPTFADRIKAWRYLAMLGNPTTHIRNAVGNVIFGQTVKARDSVSALLQKAILRGDKADLRTRSFHTDKAATAFATADFENVKAELSGNRYDSDMTEIQKRQNKLGPLQGLADFNSEMMDKVDMRAKKRAYIRSLANYLTAKGVDTTNDIPPSILIDARAHAIEEAQYCTFQNFSELAQTIQSWEDRNEATKLLIGGTMPFKRTPINITKAAVDYSPVGLGIGIRDTVRAVNRGDVTATEGIDKIASGLTGSAIAGLGALMAWFGLLQAGDDNDDKTGVLDDAEGSQEYSLVIPVGKSQFMRDTFGFQEGDAISYSIDWAAPAVIPLIMGAEAFNVLAKRDAETTFGEAVLESVLRMFDPIVEMTCMMGFNDAIREGAYNKDNFVYGFLSGALKSYTGQFVPTILSKTAKTIDPVTRTTFYDANSKMPKLLQQVLQYNANKIPGLSQKQPAALDVWGNEIRRSDNVLLRVLQNFASPGELKKVNHSAVNDELRRLNSLGYEGMIPSKLSKSSKIDEERISAEQWSAWQTEKGQAAYNSLRNFMGTSEYQALTDEQKAKFVEKVYDFASASGKVAAGGSDEDLAKWITAANASEAETGMPREKFISLYAYKSALDNDLEEDDFYASIKQGVWEEYINGRSDLTDQQKAYVKDNIKFWTMQAASPSNYNKAKAAGYTDLTDIQALFDNRRNYDLDGDGSYTSNAEILNYISSATEDPAEREKMWNALKENGEERSYAQLEKEYRGTVNAIQTAKSRLDEIVSADKQSAFASAASGADSQKKLKKALLSVDATEEERIAYYNLQSAKRGWKTSWYNVKMN